MKNLFLLLILALAVAGCNSNPVKVEGIVGVRDFHGDESWEDTDNQPGAIGVRVNNAPERGWGAEGGLLFSDGSSSRADSEVLEGFLGARYSWTTDNGKWNFFGAGGLSLAYVDMFGSRTTNSPSTASTTAASGWGGHGKGKGKGHGKCKGKGHHKHGCGCGGGGGGGDDDDDDDDGGGDGDGGGGSGGGSSSSDFSNDDFLLAPYLSIGVNYNITQNWFAGVSVMQGFDGIGGNELDLDNTTLMFSIGWSF